MKRVKRSDLKKVVDGISNDDTEILKGGWVKKDSENLTIIKDAITGTESILNNYNEISILLDKVKKVERVNGDDNNFSETNTILEINKRLQKLNEESFFIPLELGKLNDVDKQLGISSVDLINGYIKKVKKKIGEILKPERIEATEKAINIIQSDKNISDLIKRDNNSGLTKGDYAPLRMYDPSESSYDTKGIEIYNLLKDYMANIILDGPGKEYAMKNLEKFRKEVRKEIFNISKLQNLKGAMDELATVKSINFGEEIITKPDRKRKPRTPETEEKGPPTIEIGDADKANKVYMDIMQGDYSGGTLRMSINKAKDILLAKNRADYDTTLMNIDDDDEKQKLRERYEELNTQIKNYGKEDVAKEWEKAFGETLTKLKLTDATEQEIKREIEDQETGTREAFKKPNIRIPTLPERISRSEALNRIRLALEKAGTTPAIVEKTMQEINALDKSQLMQTLNASGYNILDIVDMAPLLSSVQTEEQKAKLEAEKDAMTRVRKKVKDKLLTKARAKISKRMISDILRELKKDKKNFKKLMDNSTRGISKDDSNIVANKLIEDDEIDKKIYKDLSNKVVETNKRVKAATDGNTPKKEKTTVDIQNNLRMIREEQLNTVDEEGFHLGGKFTGAENSRVNLSKFVRAGISEVIETNNNKKNPRIKPFMDFMKRFREKNKEALDDMYGEMKSMEKNKAIVKMGAGLYRKMKKNKGSVKGGMIIEDEDIPYVEFPGDVLPYEEFDDDIRPLGGISNDDGELFGKYTEPYTYDAYPAKESVNESLNSQDTTGEMMGLHLYGNKKVRQFNPAGYIDPVAFNGKTGDIPDTMLYGKPVMKRENLQNMLFKRVNQKNFVELPQYSDTNSNTLGIGKNGGGMNPANYMQTVPISYFDERGTSHTFDYNRGNGVGPDFREVVGQNVDYNRGVMTSNELAAKKRLNDYYLSQEKRNFN